MSTTAINPNQKFATGMEAAIDYAKDKPTLIDGYYGDIRMGRVVTTKDGSRRMFNFPFKTAGSGEQCAAMSYPIAVKGNVTAAMVQSFHNQYGDIEQGDLVEVTVKGGRVDRIRRQKPVSFNTISINSKLVEQTEEAYDPETGELIGSSADGDAAALLAARTGAGQVEDKDGEGMPF